MDSLTHIVLGACVGEVVAGKRLGKTALIAGAVAQSIPDLDFIASFWMSPAGDLLAHRGFTHSFLFIILISYPLALMVVRWKWISPMSVRSWSFFILLELLIHIMLDAFNAYGTAWFEPFSHYRVSFNSLFVLDPFFSIWPLLAAISLMILPIQNKQRIKWAWLGIAISVLYLVTSLVNKQLTSTPIENSLAKHQIKYHRYFSTPTPANIWLWYIVAEDNQGLYVGYRSVFDSQTEISFQFFNKNKHLLDTINNHEDLQHLIRFSEGYYTVSTYENRLVFNDLRFGQMMGWSDPRSPFVFYYFLNHPKDNELLIQRGRFANWDHQAVLSFVDRIKGD
ncbi:MAG TPA: metal-dependent hydrolase [Cyclobacteriaceae bacterium]